MRKGTENDDILLQHDNAKLHTTVATTDATAPLGFTVLPHPVYGPDLGPTDFHLLPKLKEDFRSQTSVLMKKSTLQYTSGFGGGDLF